MTTIYNKSGLTAFFAQGDIPQGSDYQNLIYSQVNIAETAEQDMAGSLSTTKLITPLVSAANINVTQSLTIENLIVSSLDINGSMGVTLDLLIGGDTSLSGALNVAGVASFDSIFGFGLPTIISAAGTSQATSSVLPATAIVRLQGATDGAATGYKLIQNIANLQYLYNENAVSANLWPNVGCKINGLSTNIPFGLVANTLYTVLQYSSSAYAVK